MCNLWDREVDVKAGGRCIAIGFEVAFLDEEKLHDSFKPPLRITLPIVGIYMP
jgi:hypothetical protein